jgi:putative membrane protein
MIRTIMIGFVTAAAVAFIPATGAQSAEQAAKPSTQAFLKNAAEMCHAEMTLGQLAADRGANKRVREFGAQIKEDHKRISEGVQLLASRHDVKLPSEPSDEHKQKLKELSSLSGHAFDREYMQYILRDQQTEVNEFEEAMRTVEDPDVLRWTHQTLPRLRAHVEEARGIKYALQTTP